MVKKIEALLVELPCGDGNQEMVAGISGESFPWEFALAGGKQVASSPTLDYGPLDAGSSGITGAVAAGSVELCSVHRAAGWQKVDNC